MVHTFFVQTLSPGTCRLLHTSHFGLENSPSQNAEAVQHVQAVHTAGASTSPTTDCDSRLRKEQISLVARQVQSECTFRKTVSDRASYPITLPGLSIDDMMYDCELGSFRLAAGDPFQTEKVAVWLAVAGTGFTLVCDKHENRQQAESILKLLARCLQEHIQALTQPENVLLKSDRVATIVHHLLPCGRLLFMNHTVIKQIERDIEIQLRAK